MDNNKKCRLEGQKVIPRYRRSQATYRNKVRCSDCLFFGTEVCPRHKVGDAHGTG